MSERSSAVVFGGASGIGLATATLLAQQGWAVTIADLDAQVTEQRATELNDDTASPAQGPVAAATADVTDEQAVEQALRDHKEREGGLDLVVNSAGTSTLAAVVDHDSQEFQRVVNVCLTGAFHVIKHAGRTLDPSGSVVSVASLNARQPGAGLAAYCAAKAGLVSLTEVAALELGAKNIRVNAVSPGLIPTPLTNPALDIPGIEDDYVANTPLGRAGTTEEVAEAIAYLATAKWMTGENLDLNGGAHLRRYPDLLDHVTKAFG